MGLLDGFGNSVKRRVQQITHNYNSVVGESARTNMQRVYYMCLIAIPLRIYNIIMVYFSYSRETEMSRTWGMGLVATHFALMLFFVAFLLISLRQKKKAEASTFMKVFQYVVVGVIMLSGIVFVTIDQLVTANITPFLLSCIITGAVFFLRPSAAFLIYGLSYVVYFAALGLTVTDAHLLLSNRLNGITAVGVGLLISVLFWHYNYTNITQKRRIKIQQKQLEQLAYYDALTNLPNRRFLEELLKYEFVSMQRCGSETAIIILDVDDFKLINDTYGHPAGDEVLRQLGELLRNSIRRSHIVARYGGEEFIILMPQSGMEEGCQLAEQLRRLIKEHTFTAGAVALPVTCSFGVSPLQSGPTLGDFCALADKALYISKRNGKNRVEKLESADEDPFPSEMGHITSLELNAHSQKSKEAELAE